MLQLVTRVGCIMFVCLAAGPGWTAESQSCPNGLRRISQPELDALIVRHQTWLMVAKSGLQPADLRCLNLSELRFGRADLSYVDLAGTLLGSANLAGVDLTGADLTAADLSLANLSDAKISANLTRTNLFRAQLRRADLRGAKLNQAYLAEADLSDANLELAELRQADLTRASLAGAVARTASFSRADLSGADLTKADLRGSSFYTATLIATDLRDSQMQRTELSGVRWEPDSVPQGDNLIGVSGLTTLTFSVRHGHSLVRLREQLKWAGLRDLEREAAYAHERQTTEHLLQGLVRSECYSDTCEVARDPFLIPLGALRVVLFDWTAAYGLRPERTLWLLFALTMLLTPVYAVADRVARTPGGQAQAANSPSSRTSFIRALGVGLRLSLSSVVGKGWGRRALPAWAGHLSRGQFAVSLCLIAMWGAFQFGRPLQW